MSGTAPAHALGAASSSAATLPSPAAALQSPTPAATPGIAGEWILGRARPHDPIAKEAKDCVEFMDDHLDSYEPTVRVLGVLVCAVQQVIRFAELTVPASLEWAGADGNRSAVLAARRRQVRQPENVRSWSGARTHTDVERWLSERRTLESAIDSLSRCCGSTD